MIRKTRVSSKNAEILERINQTSHVVVRVFHETGVHLHLAEQNGLHFFRDCVPGRNFWMPLRKFAVRRNDAELLLPGKRLLAELVPPLVELAFVLIRPLLGHMMRSVGRARREIGEERLVRHQRLLLADPLDRLIRQVLGQVIALLRCLLRLDGLGAFIQRRIPLVRLAADESVKIFKPSAASWATDRTGPWDWSARLALRGTCQIVPSNIHSASVSGRAAKCYSA